MWNCFRPEAQGVICGAVFLIAMFVFIPFPFYDKMLEADQFPFNEVWLVFLWNRYKHCMFTCFYCIATLVAFVRIRFINDSTAMYLISWLTASVRKVLGRAVIGLLYDLPGIC